MRGIPKNDKTIMDAIAAQNSGHHYKASCLFRDAGNQVRNPQEKKQLWEAAERAKKFHYSD
jgi:hypothetical protein